MVVGTLLGAIASIFSLLLNLYIFIIVIAALISWANPDPYNPLVQVLYRLTQPVYARLRAIIPTSVNGIDFAPLIVAVLIKFIDLSLVNILQNIAKKISI